MSFSPYSIQEADTPAFAIDRSIFHSNCKEMVERASRLNVNLRVHVKTHKTIEGAKLQLEGIPEAKQAIIVSTLAELKFFADHGFQDITLGIPFGTHQLPTLAEYSKKIRSLNLFVDMEEHVSLLEKTDGVYRLFIKINTGYNRAGLDASEPEAVIRLARRITQSRNCSFLGLYSHAGHSYDQESIDEVKRVAHEERDKMANVRRILEAEGIPVPVVSCGSTPACSLSDDWKGVTEIHAGNYCCFDRMQIAIGSCESLQKDACRLLMRILSVYPSRNTILTDGGGIPLSKDKGGLENWGVIKDHPELYISKLSQEHALLTSDKPIDFSKYPIGTVLVAYPNHACMTAAQHEKYLILDGDEVVDVWIPAKFWLPFCCICVICSYTLLPSYYWKFSHLSVIDHHLYEMLL